MRKCRELDRFARLVHRAVGLQPVLLIVRPLFKEFEIAFDGFRRTRSEREPFARIFDGACGNLFETHRAPAFEDRQGGMERAGHDRGIETFTVERLVPSVVILNGGAPGSPALSHHCSHLGLVARINQDKSLAAQAVEILLDDSAHKHRGDSRIERIAALHQDLEGRCRRQRMACRSCTITSHDGRTLGGTRRSAAERYKYGNQRNL